MKGFVDNILSGCKLSRFALAISCFLLLYLFIIFVDPCGNSSQVVSKLNSPHKLIREKPFGSIGSVQVFVAKSPELFNSTLSAAEENHPDKIYILFFSEFDADSMIPWCPDCGRAQPILRKILFEADLRISLVVAMIEKLPYKTNPNYSYRIDPRFMIRRIPTLIEWKQGKVVKELGDKDCQNIKLVKEFIHNA